MAQTETHMRFECRVHRPILYLAALFFALDEAEIGGWLVGRACSVRAI